MNCRLCRGVSDEYILVCCGRAGDGSMLDTGTTSFPYGESLPLNTTGDAVAAFFLAKNLANLPALGDS